MSIDKLEHIKEIINDTGKSGIQFLNEITEYDCKDICKAIATLEKEGFLKAPHICEMPLFIYKTIFTKMGDKFVDFLLGNLYFDEFFDKAFEGKFEKQCLKKFGKVPSDSELEDILDFVEPLGRRFIYQCIYQCETALEIHNKPHEELMAFWKVLIKVIILIESAQKTSIEFLEKMLKGIDCDTICYCRGFLEILCVLKTPEISGILNLDTEEDDEM